MEGVSGMEEPRVIGQSEVAAGSGFERLMRSRAELLAEGKSRRDAVPRRSHAIWDRIRSTRDPVEILEASNVGRVPELVPIRYGRMLRSPFTFLRGSAALMAHDLAATPTSAIRVQACGDCHLMNFGLFATPERNLIFDLNDFDETLPAPWEWDLKRLTVSFVTAARDNGFGNDVGRGGVMACVRAYRTSLRAYSKMSPLDVWYDRLDAQAILDSAPNPKLRARREQVIAQARRRIGDYLYPKISEKIAGRQRLVDEPPMFYHVSVPGHEEMVHEAFADYRASLPDERRVLFDRYSLQDVAVKAVGIGSVGTACFVALFFSAENHPLLLQVKEARPSVLEPYAGASGYSNHGQRVVTGQRMMQSASDIFLGWTRGHHGRHFFVRQLRDMKMSAPVEKATADQVGPYAEMCGRTLARAHAKSGDAALISGYLGKSEAFDAAIADFSLTYADQNERDYEALVAAVKSGRVTALEEEGTD
jgi:uncharacterized protein (DUF2252 family)